MAEKRNQARGAREHNIDDARIGADTVLSAHLQDRTLVMAIEKEGEVPACILEFQGKSWQG